MNKIFLCVFVHLCLLFFSCTSGNVQDVSMNLPDSVLPDSTGKYDLFIITYPDSSLTYRLASSSNVSIARLSDFDKIISAHHTKYPKSKILLSVPDCFESGVLIQLMEKAKKEGVKVELKSM